MEPQIIQPQAVVAEAVKPTTKFRKVFRFTRKFIVYGFACIGFVFVSVLVAMQFGLLNVRGSIAERNKFFGDVPKIQPAVVSGASAKKEYVCSQINKANELVPTCPWNQSDEWSVIAAGLIKDQSTIEDVAAKTDVSPRMIATMVIPEQIRFFTSERESYKKFFEPLKILGTMSQFSLGVAGIKQQTANQIEQYAQDKNSDFYPGDGYKVLINYPVGSSHDSLLYQRLTDSRDHYFSYLYAALNVRELQAQWAKAGYDISQRPDILSTLFNLGFSKSIPKSNPQSGGTTITIGGKTYSFGDLGSEFYLSGELLKFKP